MSSSTTFTFKFFRGLGTQRRALLAADDYSEVALHPTVAAQVTALGEAHDHNRQEAPPTKFELWRESLMVVLPLISRSITWQVVSSAGLVVSLFATREVLSSIHPTWVTAALCGSFLIAELAKNVVFYFDIQRRAQIARGVQLHLFNKINRKLLVIDAQAARGFSSGNVKTLISGDVEAVEDFITSASASWIPALVTLLVVLYPIWDLAGIMGIFGIAITLIQVPIAYFVARSVEKYKTLQQHEQDALTTVVGEWVRNVRLVRYLGWENAIASRIRERLRAFSIQSGKSHGMLCLAYGTTYSWWMAPILGMLAISTLPGFELHADAFFPAVWLLSLLSNHIQFLPHSLGQFGEASASATRLVHFLGQPETRRNIREDSAYNSELLTGLGPPVKIHLEKVSIQFDERPILGEVSLCINLVDRTAIVGEVGAGKTTLLRILLGELAPTSGDIEVEFSSGVRAPLWIEGVRAALRKEMAYAPQEPFLSNASLAENIDLRCDATQLQLEECAKAAALMYDIQQFPRGFAEEVGETGINLSGGQKHRVSIARAFLSQRRYLLLDDPLSAVDSLTEHHLFQEFCTRSVGFVMVSHRVRHLPACSRIIVIERGKVVEDGAPNSLLADPLSRFKAFFESHLGGEGD